MQETIKTYQGPSIGVSQCLVTLEGFIGDVDGKTIATPADEDTFIDDGTIDSSEAVTAINALIWEMERREARINQLGAAMQKACDLLAERAQGSPARSAGHNARLELEAALNING